MPGQGLGGLAPDHKEAHSTGGKTEMGRQSHALALDSQTQSLGIHSAFSFSNLDLVLPDTHLSGANLAELCVCWAGLTWLCSLWVRMAAEPGLGVQPSAAPSSQPGVSGPGVFSVQEQPSWGTEPGCSRSKSEIAHLCATALSQPGQWADNMKGGRAVLLRCQ